MLGSKSNIRSKQYLSYRAWIQIKDENNIYQTNIPVGQPGQVLDVIFEGDVLLGIAVFEAGVVGAEEERDGGDVVGVWHDVLQDVVNDQLRGEYKRTG